MSFAIITGLSAFSEYVTAGAWRDYATPALQTLGVMREAAVAGRPLSASDFQNPSEVAKRFAATVSSSLDRASQALSSTLCVLSPMVIDGLPGGHYTPKLASVVLGFVRRDGKISPVVLGPDFVLIQTEGGAVAVFRYNEETDFASSLNLGSSLAFL